MLKTTLIAAAAVALMAFGATDAFAGRGGGGHGGGGHDGGGNGGGGHGGGQHGGGHHGGGHHGGHGWNHKFHRYPFLLNYSWYPRCHYETRKVFVKVKGRHGRIFYKPVYRDVRVCN